MSTPWKPKVRKNIHTSNKKCHSTKLCYRCGDTSHKADDCSFDVNSKRIDNIRMKNDKWTRIENSLNCLPVACYNKLNTLSSVKRLIEKLVNSF